MLRLLVHVYGLGCPVVVVNEGHYSVRRLLRSLQLLVTSHDSEKCS